MKKLRKIDSARLAFKQRVSLWATKIRVQPNQVRLQSMTRKWASCSPDGRVTFSEDLLREPQEFQNYVIVHELLHLKVPNHGKLFKSLLSAHLPGHKNVSHQIAAWPTSGKTIPVCASK